MVMWWEGLLKVLLEKWGGVCGMCFLRRGVCLLDVVLEEGVVALRSVGYLEIYTAQQGSCERASQGI